MTGDTIQSVVAVPSISSHLISLRGAEPIASGMLGISPPELQSGYRATDAMSYGQDASRHNGLAIEQKFRRLVEQWRRETRFVSRAKQMAMHPAYQQIIGMGERALSFIFEELAMRGGHWFWALNAITGGEDPAGETAGYDEAREAWLRWGQEHGYECQGRSR